MFPFNLQELAVVSRCRFNALCAMMRTIGRADAAQKLEMRTERMWYYCAGRAPTSEWWDSDINYRSTPYELLQYAFNWYKAPEGEYYWQAVYQQLLDRCAQAGTGEPQRR